MTDLKTIFLDIDGVLCNFTEAFCRVHGKSHDDVFPPGVPGDYEFHDKFGMTRDQLWRSIDDLGEDHWYEMNPYPWAQELFELCQSKARTILLTTPSLHHSSHSGKHRWIQKHFGSRFRDYLIGACKEACAQPGAVLIDDFERNCEKFTLHGGHTILFPRPWNYLWQVSDPVAHVRTQLEAVE